MALLSLGAPECLNHHSGISLKLPLSGWCSSMLAIENPTTYSQQMILETPAIRSRATDNVQTERKVQKVKIDDTLVVERDILFSPTVPHTRRRVAIQDQGGRHLSLRSRRFQVQLLGRAFNQVDGRIWLRLRGELSPLPLHHAHRRGEESQIRLDISIHCRLLVEEGHDLILHRPPIRGRIGVPLISLAS